MGRGDDAFAHAVETLTTWRMHAGAGLRVAASSDRAHEGAVVLCRLGLLVTRLAGPAGRLGQRLMLRRYAAALRLAP